jgi:hypothetical protein
MPFLRVHSVTRSKQRTALLRVLSDSELGTSSISKWEKGIAGITAAITTSRSNSCCCNPIGAAKKSEIDGYVAALSHASDAVLMVSVDA